MIDIEDSTCPNNNYYNALIYLAYFLVVVLTMKDRGFLTVHDDVWFPGHYARYDSLSDWLVYRYNTWSGRLAIEVVLPYVLGANVWIWKVLNITAFFLMSFGVVSLGSR